MISLLPIKPNCTELRIGNTVVLFSYQTAVAARHNGKLYRTAEHYSTTTSRHINQWLDLFTNGRDAETVPASFFDEILNS